MKRLKQFVSESEGLSFSFNLQDAAFVQYSGYPAATVSSLRQRLDVVQDFDPELVFLVIGSNDLADFNNSPQSVANAICDLVDTLLYILHVPTVVTCQILHRTVPHCQVRHPVDLLWFNDRVDQTNQKLMELLEVSHPGRAKFWHCKGFWNPVSKASAFSKDGVHLSVPGQYKFYNAIRAALVAYLNGNI